MGLKRVDKRVARRLYNEGKPVYMLPCRVRTDSAWMAPMMATRDHFAEDPLDTFDKVVAEYEWYNCGYAELGRYTAFYIDDAEG